MWIVKLALRRPYTFVVGAILVVILGVLSILRTPTDVFPPIDIPVISRIISVADTYDVMTARDSYRTPMSSYDAIVELRRVAGKQLDARFVEIFIELLEGKDVSFQHGEAADFEKELALEARIEETASVGGEKSRFQVAGVN